MITLLVTLLIHSINPSNTTHISIDSHKFRVVFKEIKRKRADITEKNIHYIDGVNIFRSKDVFHDLAKILYNRIDLIDVQYTGGKYRTLYGDENQNFSDFDPYIGAGYLKHEDLEEQVQWQKSLQITDLASYTKYYKSLSAEVKFYLSANKEFGIQEQFEKVMELFAFYQQAYENGNWILMHLDN